MPRWHGDCLGIFSPFEFTAQAFNSSRDPEGVWEEYESGVYEGAEAALRKCMKDFVGPNF